MPVYTRNDLVYGKVGSKFVRIMADGATPVTKMLCVHIDFTDCQLRVGADKRGNLAINGSISPEQTKRIFKQPNHLEIAMPAGVAQIEDQSK